MTKKTTEVVAESPEQSMDEVDSSQSTKPRKVKIKTEKSVTAPMSTETNERVFFKEDPTMVQTKKGGNLDEQYAKEGIMTRR